MLVMPTLPSTSWVPFSQALKAILNASRPASIAHKNLLFAIVFSFTLATKF
jgi:hypothetical protein